MIVPARLGRVPSLWVPPSRFCSRSGYISRSPPFVITQGVRTTWQPTSSSFRTEIFSALSSAAGGSLSRRTRRRHRLDSGRASCKAQHSSGASGRRVAARSLFGGGGPRLGNLRLRLASGGRGKCGRLSSCGARRHRGEKFSIQMRTSASGKSTAGRPLHCGAQPLHGQRESRQVRPPSPPDATPPSPYSIPSYPIPSPPLPSPSHPVAEAFRWVLAFRRYPAGSDLHLAFGHCTTSLAYKLCLTTERC